jgi:hypothetical protein
MGNGHIYILIKYCRAGGYLPDQNSKNSYLSVIRIFKIFVSVSVRIYVSGRAGRRAGRPDWSGGSGSTVFCPPLENRNIGGKIESKDTFVALFNLGKGERNGHGRVACKRREIGIWQHAAF